MGKKDQNHQKDPTFKVEAVLQLIRKQSPLTLKQEKFCNYACVERFLKANKDNVKKAAKQLRACLSWRETIGIENLMADEFAAEIADGLAYVAGQDDESRPVMIFRMKQDYHKSHSQKLFNRLFVFTLEVAISTMTRNMKELVILFDASFYRSASALMNILVGALKIVAENYPGQLQKAFVIDPPSLFTCLWKGVRPFVELSTVTMMVSSSDFEETHDINDFVSYPRVSSLRFSPSVTKPTARIGSSASSRFAFTASNGNNSLKPWYLSLTDTSASKVGPTSPSPRPMGPALISPFNARSYSFASPVARGHPRGGDLNGGGLIRPNAMSSTPMPQRVTDREATKRGHSFFQSPAVFFRRDGHASENGKSRDAFLPFLRFYRRPYNEMIYRSKMKPPLGGLISIVSPQLRRCHVSMSQRF
ncbi:uncharacterized protein LOC114728808 [Neltuma alba]|uniref:uncharacterized protein LOC114728808 n=1 Tax=Neltuma alba TaxID=207710 RepID=UPI0010A44E50|nr:uncharacterized protein LOC114728808 [Prosopis alba]